MYGSHSVISFLCEDCNNFYQFELRRAVNLFKRYKKYLCYSCRQKYAKKHRSDTNLKKYGVTCAMNTQQNIAKRKFLMTPEKLKEINKKTNETFIKKYGSIEEYKKQMVDLRKSTCLKKYGVENPMQNKNIVKKAIDSKLQSGKSYKISYDRRKKICELLNKRIEEAGFIWIDKNKFSYTRGKEGNVKYTFKCKECETVFQSDIHAHIPVCRVCHPYIFKGYSNIEKEICEYIKKISPSKVEENAHIFKNFPKKELDIYIPNLKLGIEVNGYFWHGHKSLNENKSEILKKTIEKKSLCEKAGIRLINVVDLDWVEHKSRFKNFFNDLILPKKKIYGRQCEFKVIDTKTAKIFCEKYHLNGFKGGYFKCGLFYKKDLVCVAIFGRNNKYENECERLCFKSGIQIVGGWEKIVKHFGKPFLHYIDLRYFPGTNITGCGYRFVYNKKFIDRRRLQKKNVINMFSDYDYSLSCYNNCIKHHYIAVFDCGNDIKFYNQHK